MDASANRNLLFRYFSAFEFAFIIILASIPLFLTLPYRVNIFLSWEGAYRLSQGQIPYRDFGMPMGYMFWVIPAVFFKLFGPQLFKHVKAQVFINLISGVAFRSVLKSLSVQPGIRLLSVVLYCISFSFFNFWPWYNHTVIVYEMVGLAFLLRYIFWEPKKWILLCLSALFIFFSFFTKQDGGGLAWLLCMVLLAGHCFYEKKWRPLLLFASSFFIIAGAFIIPLTRFNFGYWFNHGQPPHTARFSAFEIADEFFIGSQWIKFYLLLLVIMVVAHFTSARQILSEKRTVIFMLLVLGILGEASVLQVTSYTPPDNNIFYHSFAFALIFSFLSSFLHLDFSRMKPLLITAFGILLWWSGVYWKYIQRITQRFAPPDRTISSTGENIVNRKTYMIVKDTTEIPLSDWTYTPLHSFDRIYLPRPTVEGMQRLMQMDIVKNHTNIKVLNMSELTPLAVEIPYLPETGSDFPLWYHLGVAMFNKEARLFEQKINAQVYDLILFEHLPTLNNFYPFRIRDSLQVHYHKIDSFYAPRRGGETKGMIEIYIKK